MYISLSITLVLVVTVLGWAQSSSARVRQGHHLDL